MNLHEKQSIFCQNAALLIIHINDMGYSCTFGDAFRSQEQADLNAKNGIGIKDSLHCKRLAIDLNLFDPNGLYLPGSEHYKLFGSYWESLHKLNRWGGNFKTRPDGNHFEMQDI